MTKLPSPLLLPDRRESHRSRVQTDSSLASSSPTPRARTGGSGTRYSPRRRRRHEVLSPAAAAAQRHEALSPTAAAAPGLGGGGNISGADGAAAAQPSMSGFVRSALSVNALSSSAVKRAFRPSLLPSFSTLAPAFVVFDCRFSFTELDQPRTDCPETLPEVPFERPTPPNEHGWLSDLQRELVELASFLNGGYMLTSLAQETRRKKMMVKQV